MQISEQELRKHTFTPQRGRDGNVVQGVYVMYKLAECDKCGGECQAPNAVNVALGNNTEGLTIRESRPGELGWCEAFGGAVCEDCYEW